MTDPAPTTGPADTTSTPESTPSNSSEPAQGTESGEAAPEVTEPVESAQTPAEAETTEPPEVDPEEPSLDLDGAKSALSKVRKSEAAMRVRLRDAEAKLEGAKTLEEFEAARTELAEAGKAEVRTLLVENVALQHGLPDELAELLKGDTRDELVEHAKKLARFAPSTNTADPEVSGGLHPDTGSGEPAYDVDAARKRARAVRAGR